MIFNVCGRWRAGNRVAMPGEGAWLWADSTRSLQGAVKLVAALRLEDPPRIVPGHGLDLL